LLDSVYIANNCNLAMCYMAKNKIDSTCFYLMRSINSIPCLERLKLSDTDLRCLYSLTFCKLIPAELDSVFLAATPQIVQSKLAVELFHINERDQRARGYELRWF